MEHIWPPKREREYVARFPWGTVTVERQDDEASRTFGSRRCERGWGVFATVREAGRNRSVHVDPDQPIADQIVRPEIAADVIRALAAIEKDDLARPLPTVITDGSGRRWQLLD
jgi:hypothetical protein